MIKVKLDNRYGRKWFTKGRWTCSGHVFWQEALLKQANLAEWLDGHDHDFPWPQSLQSANGFFSLVRHEGESLLAAVDRLRTVPLFYGCRNGEFFLSDDAEWVRTQVADEAMDPLAEAEFRQVGYVTGPCTLFPNVHQLQAGECLIARDTPSGPSVQVERYYRYLHADPFQDDDEALLERHEEMLLRVAGRLVESLRGRPVVIPLSGGYDSRLIALLLKRLGYDNVTCFSYGRPGNHEATVSEFVAGKIGYPWLFVPYDNAQWAKWVAMPEWREYSRFADGLSTLPYIQDWPAVLSMRQRKLISEDSVFTPGHSGDFLAGSHFDKTLHALGNGGRARTVAAIRKAHYRYLINVARVPRQTSRRLDEKVAQVLEGLSVETRWEALDACESWDWQERQAKYICNSVRGYEFFGYGWRMPLWDAEMMDFWQRIPLDRDGTKLYNTHVFRLGQPYGLYAKQAGTQKHRLKALLRCLGLETLARRWKNRRERDTHHLAFNGLVPEEDWRRLLSAECPFMTYLMGQTIDEIRQFCGAK